MSKDNESRTDTDTILDSIADGVFTVDREWCIRSFNKAAELITGTPRDEAIGQRCCDVFRASICESSCALRETLESHEPVINKVIYIINSEGKRIPVSISTAILRDKGGTIIGGVETFRDLTIIQKLKQELQGRYTFHDIVSKNSRMLEIFDALPAVAESDSTVLIQGESGTGKELVARAIHNLSRRKDESIVTINCGALPDTLLEAELFGYKAGAFTDARRDKPGRFTLADKGTIFLDEIGDVSTALQSTLLRVLEEHTFEPLGATESEETDVRVIAASNKNIGELVKEGKFRQDLYYRVNVIELIIPPLRERREDISLLVDHFIEHFNAVKNKEITDISPAALSVLLNHDYPGNVRELINILEHAFALCRRTIIGLRELPEYLRSSDHSVDTETRSLDELEARFIISALRRNEWNRAQTAAELGIHKSTLWRKMKRLGINPQSR